MDAVATTGKDNPASSLNKSVIAFDMDNTLLRSLRVTEEATQQLVNDISRESGVPLPTLRAEATELLQTRPASDYGDVLPIAPSLQAKYPGQDLEQVFAKPLAEFRASEHEKAALYEGVRDMVADVKQAGLTPVVYSDRDSQSIGHMMRKVGLDDGTFAAVFSGVEKSTEMADPHRSPFLPITFHEPSDSVLETPHFAASVRGPKRSPDSFKQVAEILGTKPEHMIMVGDHVVRDVGNSQKAGVTGVWAHYGRTDDAALDLTAATGYIAGVKREHTDATVAEVRPAITIERPTDLLGALEAHGVRVVPLAPAPPQVEAAPVAPVAPARQRLAV